MAETWRNQKITLNFHVTDRNLGKYKTLDARFEQMATHKLKHVRSGLPNLQHTSINNGIQPLRVGLQWRLLTEKTIKLVHN